MKTLNISNILRYQRIVYRLLNEVIKVTKTGTTQLMVQKANNKKDELIEIIKTF